MSGTKVSRVAVESLATKLESFAGGLPEQERNVMEWILHRARNAGEAAEQDLDKVAGGQSLGDELSSMAGFDSADEPGDSEISWKYTWK
jgi:hypothetical protein